MVIDVYIRGCVCVCCNILDLAYKCFGNHVTRFVANWSMDDSYCVSNRLVMGKTDVGYLLGLGCKANHRTNIAVHIFGPDSSWKMVDDSTKTDRALSLITLFGFINIPLIYFSVVFWNTLHQGFSLGATQAEMAPEIKIGLVICTIGVWLMCSSTILVRAKALILERECDAQWVKTAV